MMTTAMELGKIDINELRAILNSGKINECCFKDAVKFRERKLMRDARRLSK